MNVALETKLTIPPAIIELDHEFFPHPWSMRDWEEYRHDHYRLYKVFDKNESQIDGFALYQCLGGEDCSHLLKIMIRPSKRKSGLGNFLLDKSMKDLASLGWIKAYLEVEEDNLSAIRLYKSQNFNVLRKIVHFYGHGRHALAMGTGIA